MRATVIAPKEEVEDDERHDNAENTRQGKIKPVLHSEEREQTFKDLVEPGSMTSRDQPETSLDEACYAIP